MNLILPAFSCTLLGQHPCINGLGQAQYKPEIRTKMKHVNKEIITHLIRLLEERKMMVRTWNHLAWRSAARASRHFCLSKTSAGSFTIPEVTSKNGSDCQMEVRNGCLTRSERKAKNTLPHIPDCSLDYPDTAHKWTVYNLNYIQHRLLICETWILS